MRVLVFISSRRFSHIRSDKKEKIRETTDRKFQKEKEIKNRNEMEEEKGIMVTKG